MMELQDVTVAYGDKVVLDKVNLTIRDGETMVIMGASGAGKSTILRLLIGLQKPTSGRVLIDGIDITNMNEDELNEIRENMGMVFQYSALFYSLTVGENVAFGLRAHTNLSDEEIEEIVRRKLRMVGLTGIQDAMPNSLSGGMKKRVSLARAIAREPKVILYDEPTAGLDPIKSNVIDRLIRSMQKNLQATSVVVTHEMRSAFNVADRIAMLHEGKFLVVLPTEEFKQSDNLLVQQFIHGWKSPNLINARGNRVEVD